MRHLGQQGKVATTYFRVKSQYDTLKPFGVPLRNEITILEQTTNDWSFFIASNLTHSLYFICLKQLAAIRHLTQLIPRFSYCVTRTVTNDTLLIHSTPTYLKSIYVVFKIIFITIANIYYGPKILFLIKSLLQE